MSLYAYFYINEKPLGTLWIHNDGSGTLERGNYDVVLKLKGHTTTARVEKFQRKNGWVTLVKAALRASTANRRKLAVRRALDVEQRDTGTDGHRSEDVGVDQPDAVDRHRADRSADEQQD